MIDFHRIVIQRILPAAPAAAAFPPFFTPAAAPAAPAANPPFFPPEAKPAAPVFPPAAKPAAPAR